MPVTTPLLPQPTPRLSSLRVGAPIGAGAAGQQWNADLLFLLAHCVQPVASVWLPYLATSPSHPTTPSSAAVSFMYIRSPGAQVLAVEVELWGTSVIGATCTVEVGTVDPVAIDLAELDGATDLTPPWATFTRPAGRRALLDVTPLTVGTPYQLTVTWTQGADSPGMSHIHIAEVPLPASDPASDTDDPGLDGDWPLPGVPLFDGGAARPSGFVRLVAQLDAARDDRRQHAQIATIPHTDWAWKTTATVLGALEWYLGRTADPYWKLHVPRIYGSSVSISHTVHVLYRTSTGTAGHDGELKVDVDAGGGATATVTITLAASTSWVYATGTISIPTSGTDQLADLRIRGRILTGGETLYIAGVALIAD